MDEFILRGYRWLCEVYVLGLYCVRYNIRFFSYVDESEAVVVLDGHTYVESISALLIPIFEFDVLGMDDYMSA